MAYGRALLVTERHRGMHPRDHRADKVEFFNYKNTEHLYRFHFTTGSKWEFATPDLELSHDISLTIHSTEVPLTATTVFEDMLLYQPEKKTAKPPAKPVCEVCYGTGFHKGFGAPCAKGCGRA